MMGPWRLPSITMMTALALLASGRTVAQSWQDFHLGTWEGALRLGYGVDQEKLRSPDATADTDFSRHRADEQLSVRNQGFFFVDPQLISGDLGITFGLVQDRERSGGTHDSRNGTLVGYAFDSTLFGALPYNGRLYANRNQSIVTQPFGRTEIAFENRGATLQLREDSPLRDRGFPYFSASVRAEQQDTREKTTSVVGQTFRRDERQNTLRIEGHKGFETADLDLQYEFADLHDREFSRSDFQSQTVRLDYSADFGPALNRRADSRLSYYTRTGVSPFSLLTAAEDLRIDHLDNLSTGYRYLLVRSDTQTGISASHNGEFDVRYQPYRNVDTDARVSALHQDLPTGTRDTYASQGAVQYRHSLPWSGTLSARIGGRYQIDDNRLTASQISVTDEAQAAPQFLGAGAGFLLNQSFIVASSIVVVDARGGSRLPTTLGLDYEIVVEGNLTRIVPSPTSAVIQPGDPLAVNYTYELDPSIRYSTTSGSASISLDYRWIAFSYEHEQSNQALISGQDSRFLDDVRKDSAKVDLRGSWEALDAQASAGYVRYDSTRLVYDQHRYTALFTYRPARSVTIALNADQTLTRFTLPLHRTDALSTQLTLDWYQGAWTTTALVGRRTYRDSLVPTEIINEARVRTRLTYGMLDLTSALTASERTRGSFQTFNWAVDLVAVRRF